MRNLQPVVGLLVAYGIMHLLALFAWFFETRGILPAELNINTLFYWLIDLISFACGAIYLMLVAGLPPMKSVALLAAVGTFTSFIAYSSHSTWPFAWWGRYSMFMAPTVGAALGAWLAAMLSERK